MAVGPVWDGGVGCLGAQTNNVIFVNTVSVGLVASRHFTNHKSNLQLFKVELRDFL